MNRYVMAGLAVIAMIAPVHAGQFPTVTAVEPALVCHYLLSAKLLARAKLKHEVIEMTKMPECQTLQRGTKVIAEDSDGAAFIGVTFPDSKTPRLLWWTYQGWFAEAIR